MSVIDIVRGLRGRKEMALATYSDAIIRAAEGRDVPLEPLERLLAAAGKTPEDFQRDVERLQRRREAARQMRDADDCPGRRSAASRKLAAAQAELDRANAAFDQIAAEVDAEMTAIRAKEQAALDASRFLADSADAVAIAHVRETEQAYSAATRELGIASSEVDRCKHAVEEAEKQLADVKAGRVELIRRFGYIGPETSEESCRQRWSRPASLTRRRGSGLRQPRMPDDRRSSAWKKPAQHCSCPDERGG
ncbi:MAG TPA: hypothetical protein VGP99_07855 [Tepidisphaeraceae bacterium]|jgi:DNA repair exonuclease SbcCD ATPase subunit|nr:hypothetical protein [Tepidisphaeraceae bacterium]